MGVTGHSLALSLALLCAVWPASASPPFSLGQYQVAYFPIAQSDDASEGAPKPLLVFAPVANSSLPSGNVPLVVFLHGFNLKPCFYSQLLFHVASHGYVVVAPELYWFTADADAGADMRVAGAVTLWLKDQLDSFLPRPNLLLPDFSKVCLAGHSRGGKDAFGVALGLGGVNVAFQAVVLIDPVDGRSNTSQSTPKLLTHEADSIDVGAPILVLGSGLGPVSKGLFFPACAAVWVGHEFFYSDSEAPAYHASVHGFGHMDMLDDVIAGDVCQQITSPANFPFVQILATAAGSLCPNGPSRVPMRTVCAGFATSFLDGVFRSKMGDFLAVLKNGVTPTGATVDEREFKVSMGFNDVLLPQVDEVASAA